MNPNLLENPRVLAQKFDTKSFSRGLPEGENPFPVQPKIGPYVVSFYFHFIISRLINPFSAQKITFGAVVECLKISHFVTVPTKDLGLTPSNSV